MMRKLKEPSLILPNVGGKFDFQMGMPWKKIVNDWKMKGGIIVHLTMYGENINNSKIIEKLHQLKSSLLIIVGSKKVPGTFYSSQISDFNIAIGNQPHSEIAALAVFLDRFFQKNELNSEFKNAEIMVLPSKRGKNISEKC